MESSTAKAAEILTSMRGEVADAIVERHYQLHPELEARYGERGRQKCREDSAYHLTYLSQSLAVSAPTLFNDYIAWAKAMLVGRGIAAQDLEDNLRVMSEVLKARLPVEMAACATGYVDNAVTQLAQMPSAPSACIAPEQPLARLAESYLAALLGSRRQEASRLILEAVGSGASIKDIYTYVFQQSQYEIGRLWQVNKITVAQEHYCSAATQMIMSQLYPQIFAGPRVSRRFVGACVAGDLHEIGMRMVSDFFELEGWDTAFLGSNVPTADLIKTLIDFHPDVLGISTTITPHIAAVAKTIAAVRATPACARITILVGGPPFCAIPDLWKQVGADGTSADARGVVAVACRLIEVGAPP